MYEYSKCTIFSRKNSFGKDRQASRVRAPCRRIYLPRNYGFVPGTKGPDAEEFDAYVLGVFEPLAEFTGRCIAVISRIDDNDDKLVLVPEGKSYSDDQIMALTEFQERFFTSIIVR